MTDRVRFEIDSRQIKEPSSNTSSYYADDETSFAFLSPRDSLTEKARPKNHATQKSVAFHNVDDSTIRKQRQGINVENAPTNENKKQCIKSGSAAAAAIAMLKKIDKPTNHVQRPPLIHHTSESSLLQKQRNHTPNPPNYFDTQILKDELDTMERMAEMQKSDTYDQQITLSEFTDAFMNERSRYTSKQPLTRTSSLKRQKRTNQNQHDESFKANDILMEFRQEFHDAGERNGDRKISWSEFLKLTERIGVKLKAKEMAKVYQQVNESSDGQISYKSFIDAYANEIKATALPTDETKFQRSRRKSVSTTDLTAFGKSTDMSNSYMHEMPSTYSQNDKRQSFRRSRKKSMSTTDLTAIKSQFSKFDKHPAHQKSYFSGVKANLSKTFSAGKCTSKKVDKKNKYDYEEERYTGERRTSSSALDLTQNDKQHLDSYASQSEQATSNRIDEMKYDGRRCRSSSETNIDNLDSLAESNLTRSRQRSFKIANTNVAPTRDIVKSWLTRHQGNSPSKLKNLLSNELKDYFKCFWISDQDFDGKLSIQEFSKMIVRLGMKLNEKDLNKAFEAADVDKDDLISFNEYLNAYFSKNVLEVLPPDQVIKQFCEDDKRHGKDYILSRASCYQLLKQLGNDVNERRLGRIMDFMMMEEDVVTLNSFYLYLGLRVM